MNRRDFLSAFAATAAGLFVPRRAYSFLWAPPVPETPGLIVVDASGIFPGSVRTLREALDGLPILPGTTVFYGM